MMDSGSLVGMTQGGAPLENWLKDYSLGHAWESGAIGGRMEVI